MTKIKLKQIDTKWIHSTQFQLNFNQSESNITFTRQEEYQSKEKKKEIDIKAQTDISD